MISEPLKFLELGTGEQEQRTWEVISIVPKVTIVRLLAFLVLAGLAFYIGIYGETIVVKLLAVIPAILSPLPFFRAHEKGYLTLTNRRLLHYHRTEGIWQNTHYTSEVRLQDISGLRADREDSWGRKMATLAVLTMYHDAIVVSAVAKAVPILSSIPLIGRIFRDTTMGKDAETAIRDLYACVRAVRAGMPLPGGGEA